MKMRSLVYPVLLGSITLSNLSSAANNNLLGSKVLSLAAKGYANCQPTLQVVGKAIKKDAKKLAHFATKSLSAGATKVGTFTKKFVQENPGTAVLAGIATTALGTLMTDEYLKIKSFRQKDELNLLSSKMYGTSDEVNHIYLDVSSIDVKRAFEMLKAVVDLKESNPTAYAQACHNLAMAIKNDRAALNSNMPAIIYFSGLLATATAFFALKK